MCGFTILITLVIHSELYSLLIDKVERAITSPSEDERISAEVLNEESLDHLLGSIPPISRVAPMDQFKRLNIYTKMAVEGKKYIFLYGDLLSKTAVFYSIQQIFDEYPSLTENDEDRIFKMINASSAIAIEKFILEMIRRNEALSFIEKRLRYIVSPNISMMKKQNEEKLEIEVNTGNYFIRSDTPLLFLHKPTDERRRGFKWGFDLKGIDFYTYEEEGEIEFTDIVNIHNYIIIKRIIFDDLQFDYYPLESSWRLMMRIFFRKGLYLACIGRSLEERPEFDLAEINLTRVFGNDWKTQIQLYFRIDIRGYPQEEMERESVRKTGYIVGLRLLTVRGGIAPF